MCLYLQLGKIHSSAPAGVDTWHRI